MNLQHLNPHRLLPALALVAILSPMAGAQSYSMFPRDALPMIQRSVLPADTDGRMGDIGYDPVSECMYFAAHSANVLHILDPKGMETIQSVKDLNEPNGIAINKDLRRLYLTCGDGTVHFFQIEPAKGPVPVPGTPPPPGFEPAGKLTELKSFNVPGEADAIRFDPKMNRVYVAHGKFVSWIGADAAGGAAAPAAAPAAAAPAANAADDWWTKIGADAAELHRLVQEKASPDMIRKAVANLSQHAGAEPAKSAAPAAAATPPAAGGEQKFTRLEMPGAPKGIAVSPDGTRLYVNVPSQSKIVVIDTEKWVINSTWDLKNAGGNYPLSTDETGRLLFVGCRQPSVVLILDANSGAEQGRYPIENDDATDLWWDAKGRRIYVSAGNGNGMVSMIREEAGKWSTEHNIPTAPGARTSILIPEKGRFIVTAPKLTYPPFVFIYLIPGPNEHHNYVPAEH